MAHLGKSSFFPMLIKCKTLKSNSQANIRPRKLKFCTQSYFDLYFTNPLEDLGSQKKSQNRYTLIYVGHFHKTDPITERKLSKVCNVFLFNETCHLVRYCNKYGSSIKF